MLRTAIGGLLGAAIVVALLLLASRDGPGLLAAGKRQQAEAGEAKFRTEPQHVVLYSVHKGTYQTLGLTFQKLSRLARARGIRPTGDYGDAVYLQSPDAVKPDELLIGVQIPVTAEAVRQKGRLQALACAMRLGTTDVKTVPERAVAWVTKPKGAAEARLAGLYAGLHNLIQTQRAGAITCPPEQRFLAAARIPNNCELSDLTTELMVPMEKRPAAGR
jgi:hypothetical protein